MDVFNLGADEWDRIEEREGWRAKDVWIGQRLNAELMGGSMYELEPGNTLFPYHTHHANEEWLIVLRGAPTLRTADGEQTLREGDVAVFRRGADGFHQVINRTETPHASSCSRRCSCPRSSSTRTAARSARATRPASGSCSAARGRRSTTGTARTEPLPGQLEARDARELDVRPAGARTMRSSTASQCRQRPTIPGASR